MTAQSPPLHQRTLYIPRMSTEGARCMAASFQSIGVDARVSPEGDGRTYQLARRYLNGDECLPEAVTLGNFLKVTEQPDYDPSRVAFLMPTSNGPCRFGHYYPLLKQIFLDRKEPVMVIAPSSATGYEDIGNGARDLVRTGWRAVVASDILRKMLHLTRPFEVNPGQTDAVFSESLDRVCAALALREVSHAHRLRQIIKALEKARDQFRTIPRKPDYHPLLIGVVGEIFCRLNTFSNDHLVKRIEAYGGQVWLSDVSEWVWYTNDEQILNLNRRGKALSIEMLGCKIRHAVMHSDEQKLLAPFKTDFRTIPEPVHTRHVLEKSRPYLPREGAHGEMVLSVGKTVWYQQHGAAGVIDISPFTCMNGIVSEAIYPRVSRDLEGFPVRVFYYDALLKDWDSEVEIFMEMARNYSQRQI